jgi:hypothetical protein
LNTKEIQKLIEEEEERKKFVNDLDIVKNSQNILIQLENEQKEILGKF